MKHTKKESISSKFQHKVRIELLKNAVEATAHVIQGEVTDCDSFQIPVLTNWVEYKKPQKAMSISSKFQYKVRIELLKNFVP
jgi:hypothetical protein